MQRMARKYFHVNEILELCGVKKDFVIRLERERLIEAVKRRKGKVYSQEQLDRVRIARVLMEEMGLNLEGVEVVLHMREQMIAAQRQFLILLRALAERGGKNEH